MINQKIKQSTRSKKEDKDDLQEEKEARPSPAIKKGRNLIEEFNRDELLLNEIKNIASSFKEISSIGSLEHDKDSNE